MKTIGVVSGKGGTGKTTVAYSLVHAMTQRGFKTALLDVDMTGPNVTDILQNSEIQVIDDLFIPSCENGINYISLGQIASEGDPVLWDGADIKEAANQLLTRTKWGELDYLVVDFPPGTGTEAQAIMPKMDFVIIVTVPSILSQSNVTRMIEMMRETRTPILGLIKNMTKFKCPKCDEQHTIFPEDHNFEDIGIPTLAEIPLNPTFAKEKLINNFPLDPILDAMDNPIVLRPPVQSFRRLMMEMIFKGGKK